MLTSVPVPRWAASWIGALLIGGCSGVLVAHAQSTTASDGGVAAAAKPAPEVFDVAVYGATPGGIASAVAAAQEGMSVVLVDPHDHVGGIWSNGLSGAEESHMRRETFSGLLARWLKELGRGDLVAELRVGWRPQQAQSLFERHLAEAGVVVRLQQPVIDVERQHTKVRAIVGGTGQRYQAGVFIDATYEGDLMAMAGAAFTVGREARDMYEESLAGWLPGPARSIGASSEGFADVPTTILNSSLRDAQPGAADPDVMCYQARALYSVDPASPPLPVPDGYDANDYRHVAAYFRAHPQTQLEDFVYFGSANWVSLVDYSPSLPISICALGIGERWLVADHRVRQELKREVRDYTLGLLHFLASDAAVPAAIRSRIGALRLNRDFFADNGHWPRQIYVRQGRRMRGAYVMTQADVLERRTKPDGVALGSHALDSHDVHRAVRSDGQLQTEGGFFIPIELAYEIPYRSIHTAAGDIDNLLVPVALSSSHVAYSSLRVEPVWIMLGEAAGVAASLARRGDGNVRAIDVQALRTRLRQRGLILDESAIPELPKPLRKRYLYGIAALLIGGAGGAGGWYWRRRRAAAAARAA